MRGAEEWACRHSPWRSLRSRPAHSRHRREWGSGRHVRLSAGLVHEGIGLSGIIHEDRRAKSLHCCSAWRFCQPWPGWISSGYIRRGTFHGPGFPGCQDRAIASAVVLLASIIIARAIWQVGGRMNANQLLEGKVATYRQLVDLWNGLVRNERETGDRGRAQSLEELGTLEASLAVYGGTRVLKAHLALRASERGRGRQSPEVRLQLAKLLWEIRKDLGSETVGLTAEDLQQLLFADAETVSIPANTSDLPRSSASCVAEIRFLRRSREHRAPGLLHHADLQPAGVRPAGDRLLPPAGLSRQGTDHPG